MELVRFSDIASKEVVNFGNGKCLGSFADCDIRINPATGQIIEVILASRPGLSSLFINSAPIHVIPWDAIVRIGIDTIIVCLDDEK